MSKQRATCTAEEVARLLEPGLEVFVAGGMSYPAAVVGALSARPESTAGARFVFTHPPGFSQPALRAPAAEIEVYFLTPALRDLEEVRFVPMQYRRIARRLAERRFDLAIFQVAPPGPRGELALGLGADFAPTVARAAKHLVLEVNPALPRLPGAPTVDPDVPATMVEGPSVEPPTSGDAGGRDGGDVARRIGAHVATLVEDGDCLQTGIGTIPDAVLASLAGKNDLGFHSGMATDALRALVEAGVVTGTRKEVDRGVAVTGFLLGSRQLYDWASSRQDLALRPVEYTHDPRVIASLSGFVAVNSAVEVDLLGQVNAEMVEGAQISGTGGSVDFLRGAALAPRGRSIVALPATARAGARSRLVPRLGSSAVTTALRTDIDYVVTEHGIARLAGASVRVRAERLARIAAPEFRDGLERAAAAL